MHTTICAPRHGWAFGASERQNTVPRGDPCSPKWSIGSAMVKSPKLCPLKSRLKIRHGQLNAHSCHFGPFLDPENLSMPPGPSHTLSGKLCLGPRRDLGQNVAAQKSASDALAVPQLAGGTKVRPLLVYLYPPNCTVPLVRPEMFIPGAKRTQCPSHCRPMTAQVVQWVRNGPTVQSRRQNCWLNICPGPIAAFFVVLANGGPSDASPRPLPVFHALARDICPAPRGGRSVARCHRESRDLVLLAIPP